MSTEMYADFIPMDPEPTADAIKAKHVLDTLSQMQEDGASTRAQFEFLRRQLPRDEEHEDERLSIEVRLERQEMVKVDLHYVKESTASTLVAWENSDALPAETKEVGVRLLRALEKVRAEGEAEVSQHWKTETEMLSELWQSDPDVNEYFNSTPTRPPKDKPLVEDPDDDQSVLNCPDLKKNERVKEPKKKSDEKLISKKAGLENIKEEAPRKYPLKTRPVAEHLYESGKKVSSVSERPKPVTDSQDDEGPDHLRRDAWAEALRELTAEPWKFDRELHGRTGDQGLEGDVLHFTVVSPEVYSARLTVIPMPKGQQEVTLELQVKEKTQRRTELLTEDEAEKLHLDPTAFVKKTLELE